MTDNDTSCQKVKTCDNCVNAIICTIRTAIYNSLPFTGIIKTSQIAEQCNRFCHYLDSELYLTSHTTKNGDEDNE